MSGTLTRCRSCGRDTTTTEDWRCTYCGQPKPVTAERIDVAEPEAETRAEPVSYGGPSLREDLGPQIAATVLAALIAVIGFLLGSELLLVAAAAVLVVAVVAKIVADGW